MLISLPACKAFDTALLNPSAVTIAPKLPAMENSAQGETDVVVSRGRTTVSAGSQDLSTLFEREVREAITEPYGDKKGSLELKVTTTRRREGAGWAFPAIFSAGFLCYVGMPYASPRLWVSTQLDVLDNQRRLLATYRAEGEAKAVLSVFSPTNYADPYRVLYLQAVHQCLDEIKVKLQPDMQRLTSQLQ